MSFNLRGYAESRRLRVRNLHDGAPVPPARKTKRERIGGYRGSADRFDTIIGRDGYVHAGGCPAGQVGFCVLCRSPRALSARLALLATVGVTITQTGDCEAAGFAPRERIDDLLRTLRVYRRRESAVGARAGERAGFLPHPRPVVRRRDV